MTAPDSLFHRDFIHIGEFSQNSQSYKVSTKKLIERSKHFEDLSKTKSASFIYAVRGQNEIYLEHELPGLEAFVNAVNNGFVTLDEVRVFERAFRLFGLRNVEVVAREVATLVVHTENVVPPAKHTYNTTVHTRWCALQLNNFGQAAIVTLFNLAEIMSDKEATHAFMSAAQAIEKLDSLKEKHLGFVAGMYSGVIYCAFASQTARDAFIAALALSWEPVCPHVERLLPKNVFAFKQEFIYHRTYDVSVGAWFTTIDPLL